MRNISLFVEDNAHEAFLSSILQCFASEYDVEIDLKSHSVRGGRGKVITELRQYQQDLQRNRADLPDLIVVGTDSNCTGFLEREREINQVISDFIGLVISAVPEPHIERWLLLDSEAFKTVFGKGCPAPDQKCERDRYKRLLLEAIHGAGVIPILGGIEHAADIVNAMDLQRVEQIDKSIERLLKALQRQFRIWQQTEN